MALRVVLPFGEKANVRDLIFSILTEEHPLKIAELANRIRKHHRKSVTFQAVRKAALQLVEQGVLKRENNKYSVRKDWLAETQQWLSDVQRRLHSEPREMQVSQENLSVMKFCSVNEAISYWSGLIEEWQKNFKEGDPNVNCWQGDHIWEGALHADRERNIMGRLKDKGIVSYALSSSDTPLDRSIVKFFQEVGLNVLTGEASANQCGYYVGTYGDLVVSTQYPDEIVKEMDLFFSKATKLESLNLQELAEIVNRPCEVKLTVMQNLAMAEQINRSIIAQFE